MTVDLDLDWRVRLAAMQRIRQIQSTGDGLARAADLDQGFLFNGERIALWSSQRGIWRPRQLKELGAALTVVTAPRVEGRRPAYDDEVAADDRGWFGYKYEGTNANTWTNVAVRRAMELGRPLIYLYGIAKGVYEPIFPTYVTSDNPATLTFSLQTDQPLDARDPATILSSLQAPRREYRTVAVKQRVHQHRFRELVLGAYRRQCAVCTLRHEVLLDAAHILPDRDDRGLPEIPNGLALCKIHHSAYDAHIIGISPDLIVHVREDILAEVDGPMLEHGLKAMGGRRIGVPRPHEQRPNRDFLDERYRRFRAA